jgi:hypothetical protein
MVSFLRWATSSDNSLTIAVKTVTIFMVDWPFRQTVLIWTLKESLLYSEGSKTAKQQTSVKQAASRALLTAYFCCFLACLPFNPEDGDIFLQVAGRLSPDYMALYHRRLNSSDCT